MQIPKNVPLVISDMEGNIERPTNTPWWMEAHVPHAHRPATITLVHQGQNWAMWKCGASPRGFSEDTHIREAADNLLAFARALAEQIPALQKVGARTAPALEYGVDPHRDLKTGALPDDIIKALAEREKAVVETWKALAPAVKKTGASTTEEIVRGWALSVMDKGDTSFPNTL